MMYDLVGAKRATEAPHEHEAVLVHPARAAAEPDAHVAAVIHPAALDRR